MSAKLNSIGFNFQKISITKNFLSDELVLKRERQWWKISFFLGEATHPIGFKDRRFR
jgi:hypothetical protein